MTDSAASLPEAVVAAARDRSATIATAESLTGGLVCAALVDVPGASDVVRGGIVAYAADVKVSNLKWTGASVRFGRAFVRLGVRDIGSPFRRTRGKHSPQSPHNFGECSAAVRCFVRGFVLL